MRTYAFMVYYFDDGSKAVDVRAMGEEHYAANFDKSPLRGLDLNFCHIERRTLAKSVRNVRRLQ